MKGIKSMVGVAVIVLGYFIVVKPAINVALFFNLLSTVSIAKINYYTMELAVS